MLTLPRGQYDQLKTQMTVEEKLIAPISSGQKLGRSNCHWMIRSSQPDRWSRRSHTRRELFCPPSETISNFTGIPRNDKPPAITPAFPTGRHSGFPHRPSFRLSPPAVIRLSHRPSFRLSPPAVIRLSHRPSFRLSPPAVIPAFPTGRRSGFPHRPSFRLSPPAVRSRLSHRPSFRFPHRPSFRLSPPPSFRRRPESSLTTCRLRRHIISSDPETGKPKQTW